MRGTVGEPRTAANTHSVRIPPAGDRVCHQVQLPVQAVALRVAGRRPQLHNQERQTKQQRRRRASAWLGTGGRRWRPLRWMCAGDPGAGCGTGPRGTGPTAHWATARRGWILLVAQVGVVGVGGGAGAGDDSPTGPGCSRWRRGIAGSHRW